jgi:hypothetical protein
MLPPASCRAPPPAAAAADATPESLPDLRQILLLLADRSHSSLLSPCEISGTEYCASSSSVPCVRQESFTPGGYVCMFFFRRRGVSTSPKFRYEKNEKRTLIGFYFILFLISKFWRFFFFKNVAKLVEFILENQKNCKFYFPNFFVEKWRNFARMKKPWRISVYLYIPVKCFLWANFRHFEDFFCF